MTDPIRRAASRAKRKSLRQLVRLKRQGLLPFSMFDDVADRTQREQRAAQKLERIYHQGQSLAWEGRAVLDELMQKHGGVHLSPAHTAAIQEVFAIILWGELAAWKASARLAMELVPMDAKMAATSQAHDEARHFYVMREYLAAVGEVPGGVKKHTDKLLLRVLEADHLAKLLLGMQLVIEPLALTLFHLVRERRVDPVLGDLLVYYERDEARHVALGVLYLPEVLRRMSRREQLSLARWQLKSYLMQFDILREIEPHLAALGVDVREAMRLARKKQVQATALLAEAMGRDLPVTEVFLRVVDFKAEFSFPRERYRSTAAKVVGAARSALSGLDGDHALFEGLGRAARDRA